MSTDHVRKTEEVQGSIQETKPWTSPKDFWVTDDLVMSDKLIKPITMDEMIKMYEALGAVATPNILLVHSTPHQNDDLYDAMSVPKKKSPGWWT